jgi:hypothetical protein
MSRFTSDSDKRSLGRKFAFGLTVVDKSSTYKGVLLSLPPSDVFVGRSTCSPKEPLQDYY